MTEIVWDPSSTAQPVPRVLEIRQRTRHGELVQDLVPSVVALTAEGEVVGEGAKRLRTMKASVKRNQSIWWDTKDEIGTRRVYLGAPDGYRTPKDIAARILRFLHEAALYEDPRPIDRIVITVPASFGLTQRSDTELAAKEAGLDVKSGDLLDEPVAAFLDYFNETKGAFLEGKNSARVLVMDFGGGAADVALIQVTKSDGGLQLARKGVSRFHQIGGSDIDDVIAVDVLYPELLKENSIPEFSLNFKNKRDHVFPALSAIAESLKKNLSSEVTKRIKLGTFSESDPVLAASLPTTYTFDTGNPDYPAVTLTKPRLTLQQLRKVVDPFLNRTLLMPKEGEYFSIRSIFAPIRDCLVRAQWTPQHVDAVLLVGGSSLYYDVSRQLAKYFPDAAILTYGKALDAQRCVGRGAAYHALALAVYGSSPLTLTLSDGIFNRATNGLHHLVQFGAVLPYRIPSVGAVLSKRYRLESELGHGGMGWVFAGFDEWLDRPVAVKFVKQDDHLSQAQRDAFKREAKALAKLSHPNIVVVHDYGIHENAPFLVMERVDGQSLSDLAKLSGIPVVLCVEYIRQVASALFYAHSKRLIHRDVKPDNIVIGSDGRARLVDFGIAHEIGTTGKFTSPGVVKGTRGYMAPEYERGSPATVASDIYSLGVTLDKILSAGAPIPSLPDELRALLFDMTANDPVDRPKDCSEVERRLREIVVKLRKPRDEDTERDTKPMVISDQDDVTAGDETAPTPVMALAWSSLRSGRQELFVVAGGEILSRWWEYGRGWLDWVAMPSLPDNDPAMAIAAGYHMRGYDLFAVSTAGRLFRTNLDGIAGTWAPWEEFRLPTAATALACSSFGVDLQQSWGEGRQELFVAAGCEILSRGWWSDEEWSDWEVLPSLPGKSPAVAITAGYPQAEYPDLFAVSTMGRVFYTRADHGNWAPWEEFHLPTPATALAYSSSSREDEHRELFVVAGGEILSRWWSYEDAKWSDWAIMPTLPDKNPAVAITAGYPRARHRVLFAVSTTGRLFRTWFDVHAGTWAPWEDGGDVSHEVADWVWTFKQPSVP